MKYKSDVQITGLRPEMLIADQVVETVYNELGNADNCVCTSAVEGKHSRGSLHYLGLAKDYRIWGFEELGIPIARVAEKIRAALPRGFDVVVEPTHIHIEFQPKTGINHE